MNLKCYMYYVLFRIDHVYTLILYFYYCKYIRSENYTQFRHIDLNMKNILKNRNANQIQNTILFIDENNDDYTKTLLNMKKYFFE